MGDQRERQQWNTRFAQFVEPLLDRYFDRLEEQAKAMRSPCPRFGDYKHFCWGGGLNVVVREVLQEWSVICTGERGHLPNVVASGAGTLAYLTTAAMGMSANEAMQSQDKWRLEQVLSSVRVARIGLAPRRYECLRPTFLKTHPEDHKMVPAWEDPTHGCWIEWERFVRAVTYSPLSETKVQHLARVDWLAEVVACLNTNSRESIEKRERATQRHERMLALARQGSWIVSLSMLDA